MTAPVLTKEQVESWEMEAASDRLGALDWNGRFVALAKSHEALRAERDELQRRVPPYEATAYIKLLESERDALKARVELYENAGVAELGARNVNVASYCREWESRAEKAEARVAVLAAECKARRALAAAYSNQSGYLDRVDAVDAARAATDANGGLS